MPSAASRPRLHCPRPLASGLSLGLPPAAARHVQVLRMQPGDELTLFDGTGGEFTAAIERMGRSEVTVRVTAHDPIEREPAVQVHLAVGMPANERMDWLVEKATELGAASVQPLAVERSVLRLAGERAQKKQQHWQAVAAAACEQCGRNRLPFIHPVRGLGEWLDGHAQGQGYLLTPGVAPRPQEASAGGPFTVLSGPEGGLTQAEQRSAQDRGFLPLNLGPRVLRAETAPLAALVLLTLGT